MELTYILIAALIIVLPIILTKLLAGGSKDTRKVLGSEPRTPRPAPAADAANAAMEAAMARAARESKIEAIKRLRDTGLSLAAAKDAVDTLEKKPAAARPAGLVATLRQAQEMSDEVQKLAKKGRKIEAIKLIRERTGMGLKEAKDLVDRLG
jgi:ribosomal protein L7/L12